ncbi:MAG: DinB family protein [Acidimicrobiales bacterium]
MNEVLLELYRHKTWATTRLIRACLGLTEEDLSATVAGTYGGIHETLQHLVSSDESYFATASGQDLEDQLGDELVPLGELAERMLRTAVRWEQLAGDDAAATREITTSDGWTMPAAVPMAQAIHHADDHRSHVLTILGARGIELPALDIGEDLDVWHHAIDSGQMTQRG